MRNSHEDKEKQTLPCGAVKSDSAASKSTVPSHLLNQLLRAASSVTRNLGEGYERIQKGAIHILGGDSSKLPPLK